MLTLQQTSPRIRLINLFVPPSNDPFLTTFRKQLNPKIVPIKRSLSILSNTREYPTVKQQKIELSEKDYVKINRSYQSLKKSKKSYLKNCEETQNSEMQKNDPQYLRLVQIRKSMLKTRQKESRKGEQQPGSLDLRDFDESLVKTVTEGCESRRNLKGRPKAEFEGNRIRYVKSRAEMKGDSMKQKEV